MLAQNTRDSFQCRKKHFL